MAEADVAELKEGISLYFIIDAIRNDTVQGLLQLIAPKGIFVTVLLNLKLKQTLLFLKI